MGARVGLGQLEHQAEPGRWAEPVGTEVGEAARPFQPQVDLRVGRPMEACPQEAFQQEAFQQEAIQHVAYLVEGQRGLRREQRVDPSIA